MSDLLQTGRHTIDIAYDWVPVSGSPFSVNVRRGCDPRKCRAFGPGLDRGITLRNNQFTVETKCEKCKIFEIRFYLLVFVLNMLFFRIFRGAGTGGLGLAIEGPSEAKMTCKDNRDGSCTVEYIPTEPGDYDISIKFADQHIPGKFKKFYQDFFFCEIRK